jgi:rhomboid protease GluP
MTRSGVGVTFFLILANLVYFLYEVSLVGPALLTGELTALGVASVGGIDYASLIHQPWTLVSAMFAHASVMHLVGNMVSLLLAGLLLEPVMGSSRFAFVYVFSGIIGNLAAALFTPTTVSVGASGAVFGILAAVLIYALQNKFRLGSGLVFVAYGWIIVVNLYATFSTAGISIPAHLGGMLAGLLAAFAFEK